MALWDLVHAFCFEPDHELVFGPESLHKHQHRTGYVALPNVTPGWEVDRESAEGSLPGYTPNQGRYTSSTINNMDFNLKKIETILSKLISKDARLSRVSLNRRSAM